MNHVIDILKRVSAILANDHFVGTSGRHFDTYINKDALYPHTKETSEVGKMFAEKYQDLEIDVVAAPALGGIILSQWTAYYLSELKGKEILGIYAEKKDGVLQFTRGYGEHLKNKNVLVIEDLTTTGGSLKKVIDCVKQAGGNVVAASVMVNRDPQLVNAETLGAPFFPLAELVIESYEATDCPLCKNNVPVNTKIGHGKKFVESKR
ncbi:MAG: phosphoribosyltransferase family protein [Patescibacteria group bacterium]